MHYIHLIVTPAEDASHAIAIAEQQLNVQFEDYGFDWAVVGGRWTGWFETIALNHKHLDALFAYRYLLPWHCPEDRTLQLTDRLFQLVFNQEHVPYYCNHRGAKPVSAVQLTKKLIKQIKAHPFYKEEEYFVLNGSLDESHVGQWVVIVDGHC